MLCYNYFRFHYNVYRLLSRVTFGYIHPNKVSSKQSLQHCCNGNFYAKCHTQALKHCTNIVLRNREKSTCCKTENWIIKTEILKIIIVNILYVDYLTLNLVHASWNNNTAHIKGDMQRYITKFMKSGF